MKLRRFITALAASATLFLTGIPPAHAYQADFHLANGCTIRASNAVTLLNNQTLAFTGTVSAATSGSGCAALQVKLRYHIPGYATEVEGATAYWPLGFLPVVNGRYTLQLTLQVTAAHWTDHNALPVVPWLGGGARGVRLYCC